MPGVSPVQWSVPSAECWHSDLLEKTPRDNVNFYLGELNWALRGGDILHPALSNFNKKYSSLYFTTNTSGGGGVLGNQRSSRILCIIWTFSSLIRNINDRDVLFLHRPPTLIPLAPTACWILYFSPSSYLLPPHNNKQHSKVRFLIWSIMSLSAFKTISKFSVKDENSIMYQIHLTIMLTLNLISWCYVGLLSCLAINLSRYAWLCKSGLPWPNWSNGIQDISWQMNFF